MCTGERGGGASAGTGKRNSASTDHRGGETEAPQAPRFKAVGVPTKGKEIVLLLN